MNRATIYTDVVDQQGYYPDEKTILRRRARKDLMWKKRNILSQQNVINLSPYYASRDGNVISSYPTLIGYPKYGKGLVTPEEPMQEAIGGMWHVEIPCQNRSTMQLSAQDANELKLLRFATNR